MPEIKVVAGLGNPGSRYAETRHNVGFMFVDRLAQEGRASWRLKDDAEIAEVSVGGRTLLLVKPQSFMNRSGEPLREVMRFRNFERSQLVVVHDEIDLPLGGLRLKQGGGDGGHNGLRSISACLGGVDYFRLRLGVGRPQGPGAAEREVADWVLGRFGKDERPSVDALLERSERALVALAEHGLTRAQNLYNS